MVLLTHSWIALESMLMWCKKKLHLLICLVIARTQFRYYLLPWTGRELNVALLPSSQMPSGLCTYCVTEVNNRSTTRNFAMIWKYKIYSLELTYCWEHLLCAANWLIRYYLYRIVCVSVTLWQTAVSARQGASLPIKLLHSTRRHLRSAARHQLTVPRHRLSTFGRQAFTVAGPTMFNALPDNLRDNNIRTIDEDTPFLCLSARLAH